LIAQVDLAYFLGDVSVYTGPPNVHIKHLYICDSFPNLNYFLTAPVFTPRLTKRLDKQSRVPPDYYRQTDRQFVWTVRTSRSFSSAVFHLNVVL
jgi:hypothetical protein